MKASRLGSLGSAEEDQALYRELRPRRSKIPVDFRREIAHFISAVFTHQMKSQPNKAPEPTPTSVTPRAFVRMIESKLKNADRHVARGAPAAVVAHL